MPTRLIRCGRPGLPVVTDLIMSDPEATAAFIAYAVKSGTA